MVYANDTVYGLDKKIKWIQQGLQEDLNWFSIDGIVTADIAIYGRIHSNPNSSNQIIPEAFISTKDYKQVFNDDRLAATFGFFVINRNTVFNNGIANVDLICTVNLDKIYSGAIREDERAIADVLNALNEGNMCTAINGVKYGIAQVFTGFYTEDIKFNNMQPFCCFSINIDLEYFNESCTRIIAHA